MKTALLACYLKIQARLTKSGNDATAVLRMFEQNFIRYFTLTIKHLPGQTTLIVVAYAELISLTGIHEIAKAIATHISRDHSPLALAK